jgi:hypothetical protein
MDTLKEAILLARYSYILERKNALNEVTFKIAAFYQTSIGAVAIAQFTMLKLAADGTFGAANYAMITKFLLATFIITSTLTLLLLAGGIMSWLNYRNDEIDIEAATHGTYRKPLGFFSIFRWYETYLVLAVFCIGLLGCYAYLYFVIPVQN